MKKKHKLEPRETIYEGIVIDGPNAGEFRRVDGYVSHSLTCDGLRFGRIVVPDNFNGRGAEVGFWFDPEDCCGLTPQAHALVRLLDLAKVGRRVEFDLVSQLRQRPAMVGADCAGAAR